ncbi:zinc finger protein 518B [Antennarius striatus]|uniref:zinc finger protein 518B n=1 Tax=Antennarius striatus TaxID=241820 RepID=UPI0035B468F6
MDSVDAGSVPSEAGNKWHGTKTRRHWRRRLQARRSAVQPPAMQSEDKRGPKIGEGRERRSASWRSPEKPPQEGQHTHDCPHTLRFTCCQCWDESEYVPKDLERHFQDKHEGKAPVFSCHACSFSTHRFSYLQVHLLSHKDTFSSCCICNDNVERTWPEFRAHLTIHHCHNERYSCETCHKFSTADVGVFLEHIYFHSLAADDDDDDVTKNTNNLDTQIVPCQHCDYEAPWKLLMTKHIKSSHVCPSGQQRKKKMNEIKAIEMKPDDPVPKTKTRLTRSAVREMCWLTEDCLSLPGREFLDKYCHLSDPQTTLKETQQLLMKSVAAETDDQEWTKALQTVLVKEINHLPKSENSIISKPSDLTVLTVKNEITVAQNAATYAKTLMMTSDKETFSHESAADDTCRIHDQPGCQSDLNGQTEAKPEQDVSCPAQKESSEDTPTQDSQETNEAEEPMHEDGIELSSEFKFTNECEEQKSIHKVVPKTKTGNRRRKFRSRKADRRSAGLPLKIVLKKNPVKEKQWVSQSPLSPSGGGATGAVSCHGPPSPPATVEEVSLSVQDVLLTEAQQKKGTQASSFDLQDPSEATIPEPKPGDRTLEPVRSNGMDRNVDQNLFSPHGEPEEQTPQGSEEEAGVNGSVSGTGPFHSGAAVVDEAEICPDNKQLQTSDGDVHRPESHNEVPSAGGGAPPGQSSPEDQSEGQRNSEESSLALSPDLGVDGREVPPRSCPHLHSSPAATAIQQEPSTPSGHSWQPHPKSLERTLKLVAISPYQLVKRPAGDQPVVVLNHPDADIPEVARIMEVINRYKGEVRRVVLSRSTARALSATNGAFPKTDQPTDTPLVSRGHSRNRVQERFMLKLKLRRLSRKKYEVVGTVPTGRDAAPEFRCWFCGRVFTSQEAGIVHRQRHLMEWK